MSVVAVHGRVAEGYEELAEAFATPVVDPDRTGAAPLPREVVLDSRAWAGTIAQQEPLRGPGTAHAYHALTLGPLVAEIVRRSTGTELADVVRSRLAAPLGAATTFAPTAADLAAVARIETSDRWDEAARTADDERVARAATLAALCHPRSSGPWVFATPGPHPTWGAGVQLVSDAFPGPSPSSFGHGGAGGQVALADPDRRIGLAYVRNRMDTENPAPALTRALEDLR